MYFVTMLKKNAVYTVVEILQEHKKIKGKTMVLREEIIELTYFPENEHGKRQTKVKATLKLKKVCYQDEQNRYYEFLTNSMESTAEEELFFIKRAGISKFCSKK
ncbi:MAG: hypothetical protein HXX14_16925 [Bacteroidetes bacterium]|nr:hypothetical protein [Bacteroidota bacterium]